MQKTTTDAKGKKINRDILASVSSFAGSVLLRLSDWRGVLFDGITLQRYFFRYGDGSHVSQEILFIRDPAPAGFFYTPYSSLTEQQTDQW